MTLATLQAMKRDGWKIVGVVAYDYQLAQIADRAGVDLVSVGDSVGTVLWGQADDRDVTLDQMVLACRAVRRGVVHALVSCDCPYGPLQEGPDAAVAAARRLVDEGGADMVKLDAAAQYPDAVRAVTDAGIPVWAQFGVTPHTDPRLGGAAGTAGATTDAAAAAAREVDARAASLVAEARRLEQAGAAMLDFTHSGPVAGPAVVAAVSIPVIGGLGGGPWLDGRIRSAFAAAGYLASSLDDDTDRYAQVARVTLEALTALARDVRAGRQIRGQKPR